MALSSSRLGTAIKNALASLMDVGDEAKLLAVSNAIASAIITEITANAEVTVSMANGGLDTGGHTLQTNQGTGGVS